MVSSAVRSVTPKLSNSLCSASASSPMGIAPPLKSASNVMGLRGSWWSFLHLSSNMRATASDANRRSVDSTHRSCCGAHSSSCFAALPLWLLYWMIGSNPSRLKVQCQAPWPTHSRNEEMTRVLYWRTRWWRCVFHKFFWTVFSLEFFLTKLAHVHLISHVLTGLNDKKCVSTATPPKPLWTSRLFTVDENSSLTILKKNYSIFIVQYISKMSLKQNR